MKGGRMKCFIEVHQMQHAFVEIEVPDDASGNDIEQKAIASVTEWKPLGNAYIEYFEDITPYEEELTPS
jgi:hypothetical protein